MMIPKTLEDQLFYACTSYCDALNNYKCAKEETMFHYNWTETEKDRVMQFEKDRVKHAVQRLTDILEKINGVNDD